VDKIAASCVRYPPSTWSELRGQRPASDPEPSGSDGCPPLPRSAHIDEEQATNASLFLNDYIAFSTQWAPRAYEGFHEAVALFVLSTVAARRIRIECGPRGVYTSLYMALTARTTLFTKTTAADIGLALLEQAGLDALLADDVASPQAFLRSLTRYVPTNYGDLSEEEQARLTQQMAFTAQRGWFYEEWGQHLHCAFTAHLPLSFDRADVGLFNLLVPVASTLALALGACDVSSLHRLAPVRRFRPAGPRQYRAPER
jgi:hypothetical protein